MIQSERSYSAALRAARLAKAELDGATHHRDAALVAYRSAVRKAQTCANVAMLDPARWWGKGHYTDEQIVVLAKALAMEAD